MNIKFDLRLIALSALLAIALSLSGFSDGYAGGPLPPPKAGGPTLVGKGVEGLFNAAAVENVGVVQYILLLCKDSEFVLGPMVGIYTTPEDLPETVAECTEDGNELCIEGFVLPDIFSTTPPDSHLFACFPEGDSTNKDLYITRVKNFINANTAISAKVTLQAGHP